LQKTNSTFEASKGYNNNNKDKKNKKFFLKIENENLVWSDYLMNHWNGLDMVALVYRESFKLKNWEFV